jgi:hypothetical protein
VNLKAKGFLQAHHRGISALGVTAVYAAITVLITWPALLHPSSAVAGGEDALQYTWSFWWVREAAFKFHTSPSNLVLLHHPTGTQLPFLLAIPYIYLVGVPLATFLDPAVVYSLELFLSFLLSGLAMYLLCADLTGNRWAAFVGGLIYAFFPNRIAHAAAGHLPQVTTYWFPIYALFLARTLRAPTTRNTVLCGLSLTLSLLVHVMHIPYLLVPLTLVVLIYEFIVVRRCWPNRLTVRSLFLALSLALVLALPWFLPVASATLRGELAHMVARGSARFSSDLLSFVVPSPSNPVLQRLGLVPELARRIIPSSSHLNESLGYLGIVPLALGVWGGWRRQREAGAWSILALGAALFSLGPVLYVGGRPVTLNVDDLQVHVAMPYALIERLPFMEWGRTPGRLNATVAFALAVLAAYGLANLVKSRPRRSWMAAAAVSLFIICEFISVWPFPTSSVETPNYLALVAESSADGAVLNLPMSERSINHEALLYQTVHQRPIVGGYVHRELPGTPGLLPFLEDLTLLPPSADVIPRPDPGTIPGLLRAHDLEYVFLFEYAVRDGANTREYLTASLGAPAAVEQAVSFFQVPEEAKDLDQPVYGLNREAWHPVEMWNGVPARWMGEGAELYVYSPRLQEAALGFVALPLASPQRLQIEVNGNQLSTLVVGEWITHTTPVFGLERGLNHIALRALGGCTSLTGDPRCGGVTRAVAGNANSGCSPYEYSERCISTLFQNIHLAEIDGAPADQSPDLTLGNQVRFLGHNLAGQPEPGGRISLTIYWQAMRSMEEDYIVFVHLLGPGGELIAQHDGPPLDGLYPTSEWVVDDIFTQRVVLDAPSDVPAGQYDLLTGMYSYPSLERLPVSGDRPYARDGLVWLEAVNLLP